MAEDDATCPGNTAQLRQQIREQVFHTSRFGKTLHIPQLVFVKMNLIQRVAGANSGQRKFTQSLIQVTLDCPRVHPKFGSQRIDVQRLSAVELHQNLRQPVDQRVVNPTALPFDWPSVAIRSDEVRVQVDKPAK